MPALSRQLVSPLAFVVLLKNDMNVYKNMCNIDQLRIKTILNQGVKVSKLLMIDNYDLRLLKAVRFH